MIHGGVKKIYLEPDATPGNGTSMMVVKGMQPSEFGDLLEGE